MEKTRNQQTSPASKTLLVDQINVCMQTGEYSRAQDLLRGTAADFPNDLDLSELEKRAQDGLKRSAEANRLITESQELFSRQKSAEAIQLLRQAYELDKNNSLARSILSNALVEQAQSLVEADWLKAETLTNQALSLNPTHPTAKIILGLIVARKETSPSEDWVEGARKLQFAGDLFAALAWVAEGLAVHPHEPKLLQIQDEIQRDQDARRRQARRGDLEELRRLQREIDGATDLAGKQALAVRIQTVAAKHWTDGEILSIANALLLRLGLVSQENSSTSPRGKGATVILHVPRPGAPKPSPESSQIPRVNVASSEVSPSPVLSTPVAKSEIATKEVAKKLVASSPVLAQVAQSSIPPTLVPTSTVPTSTVAPSTVASGAIPPNPILSGNVPNSIVPGKVPLRTPMRKLRSAPSKAQQLPAPPADTAPGFESPVPAAKFTPSSPKHPTKSNSTALVLIASTAATMMVIAILFLARKHQAPVATPSASVPTVSSPVAAGPAVTTPAVTTSVASAPPVSAAARSTTEARLPDKRVSSDTGTAAKATLDDQPPAPGHNQGTLLIVAGQDDVRVFLNGRLQRQLTQGGQLRLPNLELKDYVVQVSKSGFQDPPQQKIRIRKSEEARLVFSLQPQPRLASLTIQGGAPGTTVLVDQTLVGTIQPDGTLSISTVNPGDHTVELRKDRFKPRQFKKHFAAGATTSLAAADAALDAAPAELKINFTPADANVAIAKGDLLKMVSSGVPLSLAPGTYTLTARTAERFTRSATLEVVAGQPKTLDLSLAPGGMSKWDDPGAWKQDKDSFIRKGGDFVLYGAAPASGTFLFSAMPAKGHMLQWVLNYTDPKNYVLCQMDENNFYRAVIHNGQKSDEIIVPNKGDKKSFRTLQIRVSPTELIHVIKQGDSWKVLDRWTRPGANLSLGKFGFYIPGNDEVALSSFAHYGDLNIH